jgi:hypothetical protein
MSRLTTKDRKEQRREAIRLSLIDDHLIATGQVALRGGMLDNLIELTAEQLILRREVPALLVAVGYPTEANWPQKPRRPISDVLAFA